MTREERQMYWRPIALSVDHKPNKAAEKDRIVKSGGLVKATFDPMTGKSVGPYRVWSGDINQAGLAMSRSLGDGILKEYGVTAEPEIREIELKQQDKMLVIASDGIWDVFNNKQVIQLLVPFWEKKNPVDAAQFLAKEARKKWESSQSYYIDDISVVVVFLNVKE